MADLTCSCSVFPNRPSCQSLATQEDLLCDPCRLLQERQRQLQAREIDRTGLHSSGKDDRHWQEIGWGEPEVGATWTETPLSPTIVMDYAVNEP